MTKLYISEYSGLAAVDMDGSVLAMAQPPIATQVVDYTAGVTPSAAFNAATKLVELHNDSICSLAFGVAPVATVNNMRYAAGERNVIGVPAGSNFKVSAITNT